MDRLDELKFEIKKLEYYKKNKRVSNVEKYNNDVIDAVDCYNRELKERKKEQADKDFRKDVRSEVNSYLESKKRRYFI